MTSRRRRTARSGTPRSGRARSASSTPGPARSGRSRSAQGSAPHGVIQGPDGAAWITDSGQNAIVRYDPKTEKIDGLEAAGRIPATPISTPARSTADGNPLVHRPERHLRTAQPEDRRDEGLEGPRGRGPYGIAATPSGDIYYVSLAGSHLARIDRKTGAATIIEPPTPDQGARRVWADSKGNLWVTEWNSGNLSRYTPATGAGRVWKLPGRKAARPMRSMSTSATWSGSPNWAANATLMFDPATEQWTSYPGSGEGANVRQILGRPGEVYLPESGTNRIMVVRTGGKVEGAGRFMGGRDAGGRLHRCRRPRRSRPASRHTRNATAATRLSPVATISTGRHCTASLAAGRGRNSSIIRRRCGGLPGSIPAGRRNCSTA